MDTLFTSNLRWLSESLPVMQSTNYLTNCFKASLNVEDDVTEDFSSWKTLKTENAQHN